MPTRGAIGKQIKESRQEGRGRKERMMAVEIGWMGRTGGGNKKHEEENTG